MADILYLNPEKGVVEARELEEARDIATSALDLPEVISPRKLIQESRASGRGVSFYKNYHKCAFYPWLRDRLRESQEPAPKQEGAPDTEGESIPDEEVGYFANVGVLFHKLAELLYMNKLHSVVFEFEGKETPLVWTEALRLFNYYRTQFEPTEFTPLGAEVPFDIVSHPAFGVSRFTGRIDLPVHIDRAQLDGLRQKRAVPFLNPGAYILDHKVKWRRSGVAEKEWAYLQQLWLYMMAWDILNPDDLCQGAIVNVVYAYRAHKHEPGKGTARCADGKACLAAGPKCETFLLQKPTSIQRAIAKNYLVMAEKKLNQNGHPANLEECFRYQGRVCEFHPSVGGPCDLIGETR